MRACCRYGGSCSNEEHLTVAWQRRLSLSGALQRTEFGTGRACFQSETGPQTIDKPIMSKGTVKGDGSACHTYRSQLRTRFVMLPTSSTPRAKPLRTSSSGTYSSYFSKSVFVQRTEIGHRSASAVQTSGIWISMRYIHNEKIGGSLPLPDRLPVAVVG